MLVMVLGAEAREPAERRLRGPVRHEDLAERRTRAPGCALPTHVPAPSGCGLGISARRATPAGVGMAMLVVSPVRAPRRSRNGRASAPRSAVLVSRRA